MNLTFRHGSGKETLARQRALVIGLGASGLAAGRLLLHHGATVTALDQANTETLRSETEPLRVQGIRVFLGVSTLPDEPFDLVVVSPGVSSHSALMNEAARLGIPILGELELGFRYAHSPVIAITGTNGKTTTTELVERLLNQAGRKTVAAGNIGLPLCTVAEQSRELDFLTLEVSSFQLETSDTFHPVVAVLLNLTPDHLDRYRGMEEYIRAKARIFARQQATDWAIIQYEAWQQMRDLRLAVPAQVITFSARAAEADFILRDGVLVSRWSKYPGPLLELARGHLRGPHNAENLLAALATGLVLGVPLASAVPALTSYRPAAHRCELVAEIAGVKYINDSKATNVDAVRQALLSLPAGERGAPNVWLIAGGKDKGFDYQELGPVLRERVRHAFLLGETREKIRLAWERFIACTVVDSLVEAVNKAAQQALPGEVILLSPACSSFDMFQNYQHRGEVFRQAVQAWANQQPDQRESLPLAAKS